MKFLGKFLLMAACAAAAQSPQTSQTAAPASSADQTQLAAIVKQQFGDTFTVSAKFSPSLITADFDGDGVQDVAIVADSKDPLPDSYAFKYDVSDPYHAYFGFGNPKISSTFNADPEHTHHLLIIFGIGKDAWHAATPKSKFVLVNIPFDNVEVGRMLISKKKPPIFVIKAIESQIMDSALWWEAKKKRWRWEPGNTL
ncbi:MAG TPA: hypothetical protein VKU42_12755 [Candidatus Angelobacter sp.]|nr:hypothetical protein [Candidatus Angelobacter sp.]